MNSGLEILADAVLANNLVLLQGLGLYALTRYTKDVRSAFESSIAMFAVLFTATLLVWAAEAFVPVLYALDLPFYLLVAAASAFFWNFVFAKMPLGERIDRTLPGALFNSILVGALLLLPERGVFGSGIVGYGLSAGLGYGLVLVVMAGIRERLNLSPVPKPFQGIPILLITVGLLALSFMGFRIQ